MADVVGGSRNKFIDVDYFDGDKNVVDIRAQRLRRVVEVTGQELLDAWIETYVVSATLPRELRPSRIN